MKKVKAYIKVLDELDVIEGVMKLLSYIPQDTRKPIVRFPANDFCYEDEDHKFIWSSDIIEHALTILGFQVFSRFSYDIGDSIDIWERNQVYVTFYRKKFPDGINYVVFERWIPEKDRASFEDAYKYYSCDETLKQAKNFIEIEADKNNNEINSD